MFHSMTQDDLLVFWFIYSGIASRAIKPTLGIVDPLHTLHMPERVAANSGFDVLWYVNILYSVHS